MAKKTDELTRRLSKLKTARESARTELTRAEATHEAAEKRLAVTTSEIKERWKKSPADLAAWARKEAAELEEKIGDMEKATGEK